MSVPSIVCAVLHLFAELDGVVRLKVRQAGRDMTTSPKRGDSIFGHSPKRCCVRCAIERRPPQDSNNHDNMQRKKKNWNDLW